ncbi:Sir2 family NAD-dependent protein deacetylase [Paraburkholderia sp. IMGN_8]|uniref:SIR2 family NAD-dependent protein deacylase n=1 Tax=Paraburkholderia sp. IMGN_8 TaxID=3136564 RepID=UPI003100F15C
MINSHLVERAANLIHDADALIIAVGAGMSVDSGLPDFRGSNGLWTTLLPNGMRERDIQSLTQGDCFARDPVAAWRFYGRALQVCSQTVPHEGYGILLRWAERATHGAFVYTSNVDGHFHAAGFDEERVVECHGSINFMQCTKPCCPSIWAAGSMADALGDINRLTSENLPRCSYCGGVARPNFLLFSDPAWLASRTSKQQMNFQQWQKEARKAVVIEIGAGLALPSIRMFSESLGIPLIRINPEDAGIGDLEGVAFRGSALAMLRCIDREMVN